MKKILVTLGAWLALTCAAIAQNAPGAAAVMAPIPGPACQCDLFTFGPGTLAATQTFFYSPSANGANQNFAAISPRNGTFKNLYWRVAAAPGAGNSIVLTLYVGTPASMNPTSVACTISNTNQTCSDTADTAAITIGQAWAIQAVSSASATSTGQQMGGIEQDIQ